MLSSQAGTTGSSKVAQVVAPLTTTITTKTTSSSTTTTTKSAPSMASSASFNRHEKDSETIMPSYYGCQDETVESNSNDEQSSSFKAHLQSVDKVESIKSGKHEQQQQSETFQSNKRRKQQNPSRKQSGEWSSGSDLETPESEEIATNTGSVEGK